MMGLNIFDLMNRCLIIILLLIAGSLSAQDMVKDNGIASDLHKNNIGRIVFTSREIPVSALSAGDFLQTAELTNKSDLFITVFMARSLTNYLHRLAPEWPVDSLHRSGGYEFALYVDQHLIYKSRILGAPLPQVKDTETIISKPLIDNEREGRWWSQFFWNRFLYNGGDSALTDGPHLLKLEIRPYLNGMVGEIIASGELKLAVNRRPAIDISRIRLNPVQPFTDLEVSHEPFNKDKIKELKGRIESGEFRKVNSIIVIKNGKILVEEYFNGETRDSLHDPRSVGKTFASAIFGIAESEGYFSNEMQTLGEFYRLDTFNNYSPLKEKITIQDLLTMSVALEGDDGDNNSPGNEENMYPAPDWVKFALDLPVRQDTVKQWRYFTAGVVVLGDILDKTIPAGLERYAQEKLFGPLTIRCQWQYTPQGVPNTAGGIRMRALDFAKFGQLYRNGGRWKNKQLVPKGWIARSFTKYRIIPGKQNEYYGYLFWNKRYHVNGREYETWYCTGNGGNKIFIFKDQPLVVVITASAYGQAYAHPQADRMMEEYILPAVLQDKNQ